MPDHNPLPTDELRRMLTYEECPYCKGVGLQHSPNRNGDPMDHGVPCHVCDGTGVVDADPADEIEDWMDDDQ